MSKTKAALFLGPNAPWQFASAELPILAPDEILVKVLLCTICGSDLHTILGRRNGPVPSVLGHEIVGEIVDFGSSAIRTDLRGQTLQRGDRIVWGIVANCDRCFFCKNDLPQKCEHGFKYGHQQVGERNHWQGGFASHCVLVPGTKIVRIPALLSLKSAAPLGCATATIAAAMRFADILGNDDVLIVGAGMLGLTACAMANKQGPWSVACIEKDEYRRQLAMRFGATVAAQPGLLRASDFKNGYGFDVAIECSGTNAGLLEAIELVRVGGRIVLVGAVFPSDPAPLVVERIVRKHLTLHGVHNYRSDDLLSAVDFLERHHEDFPFEDLVSHVYPLEQLTEGLTAAQVGKNIRVAIAPSIA